MDQKIADVVRVMTPEPMPEDEMIKQALDAGSHYIKAKYKDAPLTDQTIAMNACGHGFCMAVRWYEKNRLGLTPADAKDLNHD